MALALPAVSSDHTPILFWPKPEESSGRSFKYEAKWEEHPGIGKVIQEAWSQEVQGENCWEILRKKKRICTNHLQRWPRRTLKRADEQIFTLKQQLQHIQDSQQGPDALDRMKDIRKEINSLWKQEEAFWGQRSRLKWIKHGDKNTKFFHAMTIQRRDRNRLVRIQKDNGSWVEGHEDLEREILLFFKGVYSQDQGLQIYECTQHIPKLVSTEMNVDLARAVSE
ncbi:hypothetical protein SESBI_45509 [Sesbania bispinosa]|nr:hypothetical protein SESBI_45509 [Sesbania bispinosa]